MATEPFVKSTSSAELFERARRVLPGGVSRNTVHRSPHPLYTAFGEGCYVTDIEGIRRIDFSNNMASLIHGHAHPEIVGLVSQQLARGSAFATATEAEVLLAEHLCDRVPSFDKIRFVNSGTEAVMTALKAARAFTTRPKIAKVEGAYHGTYDYAEVSQTATPTNWGQADHPTSVPVAVGTPRAALDDVIVIPFNDPSGAIEILDAHAQEIACVLIDPLPHRVGLVLASNEFISALSEWTRRNDSLLVFDEVITFRNDLAGTQQRYNVTPDLTALGKMIGGGFPVGAVAGRDEVMAVLDPMQSPLRFPHSGTFSANPVTMTAGLAALQLFDRPAVARLNELGEMARMQIAESISRAGVPACVTGDGSLFRVHLRSQPPSDYRSCYGDAEQGKILASLLDHLFDAGLMLINTCSGALSTAMTEQEISRLADALYDGFKKIAPRLG